ncbi:hypothetical protein LOZ61_003005 [Ophidiomyces ophidiicola]|uniref:uncharacterized protein n=1 Tax=Ophidiomyces ophidiicola TaxID=1387563 RepID=UPI0020C40CE3|nr:uncharacterized protein LOZ57_003327 [Ophidiomyces ophidiicola]KAI1913028.1 hypothetical protein LOZ61_003005 [Ophidiomyces ophidiicola]KAI1926391.1 hypothetical protein LOZ60_003604 [Ophidiomyces ophidiicola]KAI1947089.1 hypothetical protein LOZ57_003327 [Ophidiomyces ophidiicola]KAI1958084.1 hypothetical protein LOZ59_003632 [Ophidiomyces ophidiicola]KAI2013224.1 hypothetical protein LOZ49_002247 [Ophidiomyces ophidiicola]
MSPFFISGPLLDNAGELSGINFTSDFHILQGTLLQMNNHLLPYPYNQDRSRPFFQCETLANVLYGFHRRFQPPAASQSSIKPIEVVCISDTHNLTPNTPPGDLIIHAGDLTKHGSFEELHDQLQWLSALPHPQKVIIAGNHDLLLDPSFLDHHPTRSPENSRSSALDLDWNNLNYLQDCSATLTFSNGRNLKVFGSPQTPEFGVWAFQYPAIRDVWTHRIPDDTDIVVVHGPPVLHYDVSKQGDGYLLRELRRAKPQLVVFGHIHDGYGEDSLFHDGVQSAWEDAILQRSGIVAIIRMTFWIIVVWLKVLLGLPQPSPTMLVNAAVTPGVKNVKKKEPIRLKI